MFKDSYQANFFSPVFRHNNATQSVNYGQMIVRQQLPVILAKFASAMNPYLKSPEDLALKATPVTSQGSRIELAQCSAKNRSKKPI